MLLADISDKLVIDTCPAIQKSLWLVFYEQGQALISDAKLVDA